MSSKVTSLPTSRAAPRPADAPAMPLEEIRALVKADLAAVDAMIRARLKSAVPLVDQVAEHIIGGGGKRLRPLLCVLAGRACGIDERQTHRGRRVHRVRAHGHAAARRRGRRLAEAPRPRHGQQHLRQPGERAGRATSSYSRAFQMMATVGSQRVMEIMADATNVIAEGEVLQLMNAHDPETTEQRYLEVIYRKTGRLFEAGAEVAAVLAGAPRRAAGRARALRQASRHRLSTRRRRARLPLRSRDARQEPRRRSGRRQTDAAAAACAAPWQRRAARADPAGDRTRRARAARPDRRSHRNDRRARLRDRASRSAKPTQALAALEALPDTPYSRALAALARFAQDRTS